MKMYYNMTVKVINNINYNHTLQNSVKIKLTFNHKIVIHKYYYN
jgi:hypothetical protein